MDSNDKPFGYYLSEAETYRLLAPYGFPMAPYRVLPPAAPLNVEGLNYPLALKVVSPDIPHKTDMGGIALNLNSYEEVAQTLETMEATIKERCPEAKVDGFLLQEMVGSGHEMVLGLKQDPIFGTLVMVGMGGIFVEVLGDVAWRLAPIDEEEGRRMLEQLKCYPLLQGIRGQGKADIEGLAHLLVRLGQFGLENPYITELDVNPVFVREDGLIVADALAWIQEE